MSAHDRGVRFFDALWDWTYDRQREAHDAVANRARAEGIPPCDRCAGSDDRYPELSPWCARIEGSRRFRVWRTIHRWVHNGSIRLGLNA